MRRRYRWWLLGSAIFLVVLGLATPTLIMPLLWPEPTPQPTDETGQERLTYPDSDAPIPLAELDQEQVNSIIQVGARGENRSDYCAAKDLRFRLGSFDAAAGSRFSQLVVVNDSNSTCLLAPIPGIGILGSEGSRLKAEVTQTERDLNYEPVPLEPLELAPKNTAWADLKWSGTLAGAETDHATALAIQVSPDADAALFIPPGENAGWHPRLTQGEAYDWGEDPFFDMGSGTTLQISPWQQ